MSQHKNTELRKAVAELQPYVLKALGFTIVMTFLSLAPIGYMQDVYGPVMNSGSTRTLLMVTLILVIALSISALLGWIRERLMIAASVKFSSIISRRTFEASFAANLSKFPGARLALNDLRTIRNFITSPSMTAMLEAPMGLIFLLLVFLIHPVMGLFSLAGVIAVLVIALITENRVRPLTMRAQQYSNASQNFVNDSARNALVVHAMGMQKAIQVRWLSVQNALLTYQAQASEAQSRSSAATKFVVFSKTSLILGAGVFLSLLGVLPPHASAYLIIGKILGAKAVQPMMTLIQSWKVVVTARDSFFRLDEFLEKSPKTSKRMSMPPPVGRLSIENLTVRAPGTKTTVLSNLRFDLEPGRVLAILGSSGAGKSSLARVLLGIWTPTAGNVRLDGVEISGWPKAELGQFLGYLPQDVELFDGTLADNISRFGELDTAELENVLKLVGLDTYVRSLPKGVFTEIGDDGCILSGGQRQRVGLARAIYNSPRLIVLDEPNSSLDDKGEADLNNLILELKNRGTTIVVITHRKSILTTVDQVLFLANGRLKAYGPRDDVLAKLDQPILTKAYDPKGDKLASAGRADS